MIRCYGCWIGAGIVVAALAMTGCAPSAETGGGDMDSLAAQLDQSKQAAAAATAAEQAKLAAEKVAAENAAKLAEEAAAKQAAQNNAIPPGDGTTTTTAGAGTLGEGGGYYSAIVAAHRHITTRVDDLAWTQALQHHKATTGEMPKNQEEFMAIMAEGGIPLPELEQGQELLWDPSEGDWGTLYIVEPAPEPPATAPPVE